MLPAKNSEKTDNGYMRLALALARGGLGRVSPNPLVGAVVLDVRGEIVGEGWHRDYGDAHAEVMALERAGQKAKGGTLYVTLEPCCHFGKTPPCTDRILASGIRRVVYGLLDPNPKVDGGGVRVLEAKGVRVEASLLNEECRRLVAPFLIHQTKKRPFVALKVASTMDGKIATHTGSSQFITGTAARDYGHLLRQEFDGLLTSSGTILADDPRMTCRVPASLLPAGLPYTRNPVRIVLDSTARTAPTAKVYADDGTRVILVTGFGANTKTYPKHVERLECPFASPEDSTEKRLDLAMVIERLGQAGLQSIMIEAGGETNQGFLGTGLVDRIYWFVAPKILGDRRGLGGFAGRAVDDIDHCQNFQIVESQKIEQDMLIVLE